MVYSLLGYGCWGIFPLYWKLFVAAAPLEVVCHRVLWSLGILCGLVLWLGQWEQVRRTLGNPRRLALLFISASALSVNWGLFIAAVKMERVVETGLGYFLCPIVSVFFAFLFLRERLHRLQAAAVALAFAGVVLFGWNLGQIPWIAIGLAFSFALYGLLRKTVPVDPMPGLLLETLLMTPIALGIVTVMGQRGETVFGVSWGWTLLFMSGGVVTTLPLIWFGKAAKLLPLATLGILQYVTPCMQLLVGVVIFREPFSLREGSAFVLIWIAIGLYLWPMLRRGGGRAEEIVVMEDL